MGIVRSFPGAMNGPFLDPVYAAAISDWSLPTAEIIRCCRLDGFDLEMSQSNLLIGWSDNFYWLLA